MAMVGEWLEDLAPERKRRLSLVTIVVIGLLLVGGGLTMLPWSDVQIGNEPVARTSIARVEGFRTAQFGMSESAVRAAIATDFGSKIGNVAAAIKVVENKLERTRILVVRVPDLYAGAGLTEIGYVLGYQSKALMQVNLLWGTPLSSKITSADLNVMTANLMRYFGSEGFASDRVKRNLKIAKGSVLVFQGSDKQGRTVQLVRRVEPASAVSDKKASDKAARVQRQTLRLAYIANPMKPDIFQIDKGQF